MGVKYLLILGITSLSLLSNAQSVDWVVRSDTGDAIEIGDFCIDPDGNYIQIVTVRATGANATSTVDFDPGFGTSIFTISAGFHAVFIRKLDHNRELVWVKKLQMAGPRKISSDSEGNIYLGGSFVGTQDFDPDLGGVYFMTTMPSNMGGSATKLGYVLKLNSDGEFVWAVKVADGAHSSAVNDIASGGNHIAITGEYSFGGPDVPYNNVADFDPGIGTHLIRGANPETGQPLNWNGGMYTLILSTDGAFEDLLWFEGSIKEDKGYAVEFSDENTLYVTGYIEEADHINFEPSTNEFIVENIHSTTFYVLKYVLNDGLSWVRYLDDLNPFKWAKGYGVAVDADGSVIIIGSYAGNLDIDPTSGVSQLSSASVVPNGLASVSNVFVLKLSEWGGFDWSFSLGGARFDEGAAIATDSSNNVFISGDLARSYKVDFDNSGQEYIPNSGCVDCWNVFVAKLDQSGQFYWARMIDTEGSLFGTTLHSDIDGGMVWQPYRFAPFFDESTNNGFQLDDFVQLLKFGDCGGAIYNTINETAYCSYASPNGYNTWTESGIYNELLMAKNGCDSFLTVNLTIIDTIYSDTQSLTISSGDSVFLAGDWQTNPGTYVDSFLTTMGCDSVIKTRLTVSTPCVNQFFSDTITICDGDSVLIHGNYESAAGVYSDTLTTSGGCDSISTVTVITGQGSYDFAIAWIYDGQSKFLAGAYQTVADIYADTFATTAGCDSIIETLLWVYEVENLFDTITICQGESAYLSGVNQTVAGVYADTVIVNGIGEVTNTTLIVNQPTVVSNSINLVYGDSVFLAGQWRTAAGEYCDTAGLCDTLFCTTVVIEDSLMQIAQCTGSPSSEEWAFTVGGSEDEFVIDSETDDCGNLYVIGSSHESHPAHHVIDSNGNHIHSYGPNSIDFGGNTGSNNFDFEDTISRNKYFMAKYNTHGENIWVKDFRFIPTGLDVTSEGKIGLTGTFEDQVNFDLNAGTFVMNANSGDEIFIATYDTDANLIWAKQLNGIDEDRSGGIAFGPNDQVTITCQAFRSHWIDFDPDSGAEDIYEMDTLYGSGNNTKFLVTFDAMGNWLWRFTQISRHYCGENSGAGNCVYSDHGDVFFSNLGCIFNDDTYMDAYNLYKISESGDLVWHEWVKGGDWDFYLDVIDLKVDEFGAAYVLSELKYFVVVDQANQTVLDNELHHTYPGRFHEENGGNRTFLLKYSESGQYEWSMKLGYPITMQFPAQSCTAHDLDVQGGNVVVTGQMMRNMDFEPAPEDTFILVNYDTTQWIVENLTHDAFIVSYDYNGGFKQVTGVRGPGGEGHLQIAMDSEGNALFAGEFNDGVDIDMSMQNESLVSSNGFYDIVLGKLHLGNSLNSITYFTDTVYLCSGDSQFVGGAYQTEAGIYIDTTFASTTEITTTILVVSSAIAPILSVSGNALKAYAGNGNTGGTYVWIDCDNGEIMDTTSNYWFNPPYTGNYAVVYENSGCTDTSNCIYIVSNGQNKQGKIVKNAYPSAVYDQYTIVFDHEQTNIAIDYYNVQGQLIRSEKLGKANSVQLNTTGLAAGYYLLQLTTTEGSEALRFLKILD